MAEESFRYLWKKVNAENYKYNIQTKNIVESWVKQTSFMNISLVWLGWVGFYSISNIVGYLMPHPLYVLILLFTAKSSLFIYIKYIWFGLVGFYGISNIVGYLRHRPLYTYITFPAKFSIFVYIKYKSFGWVMFYGISTIVGYLLLNHLYTYILNIYDLLTHFW